MATITRQPEDSETPGGRPASVETAGTASAVFSTWGHGNRSATGPRPGTEGSPLRAIMGWDGVIIPEESVDVVDMAREYAARAQAESCGQCFPCRIGTAWMSEILERVCAGRGEAADLDRLEKLGRYLQESARCDIGRTSPLPILDLIVHFRERFVAAVEEATPRPRGRYVAQLTAPCMSACPAHVDIPGYLECVREDRLEEAMDLIYEGCCLPGTLGRACVRYCEAKCRRGMVDEPIAIRALKRYAADRTSAMNRAGPGTSLPASPGRVAVIGAGPAGLSCAYYLELRGYRPTIFEAFSEPGGMAAVGIPDYRLPRDVLRTEARRVEEMGAEIRYGVSVGEDVTVAELFDQGYRAVFIGAGAQGSTSLYCEGEEAGYAGFMPGIEFLRRIASGEKPLVGRKMLVIGGGNVAMDCVRSALRLGFTDVNLLYRRTEKEMPADPVEMEEGREEGVKLHTLVAPVRVLAENRRVAALECVRMMLGEPDDSGRRRPIPQEGSNFVIECDAIVPAIGQACIIEKLVPAGVQVAGNNTLIVNPVTMQSGDPRVFGGGDCVTGPGTLIAALASGRRAARFIAQLLETGECRPGPADYLDQETDLLNQGREEQAPPFVAYTRRARPPVADPHTRCRDFSEVESVFSPTVARQEASRCLRCYRIVLAAVS